MQLFGFHLQSFDRQIIVLQIYKLFWIITIVAIVFVVFGMFWQTVTASRRISLTGN